MSTVSDLPQEEQASSSSSSPSSYPGPKSQDNSHDNEQMDPSPSELDTSPALITVRQLFVGNLPFRVRWQDLKDLFRRAGNVLRADVALTYDKRSKGHGTVLFATVEDAQNAVDMLHNYHWHGRVLEVREDRGYHESKQGHPKQKNASPSKPTTPFNHGATPQNAIGRQLFVGNLPFHCQWQDLKDLFRMAGNIQRADIAHGPDGRSRGFGTVLYATPEDAKKAIEMFDGSTFKGRQLRVHIDKFVGGPPAAGEDMVSAGDATLQPSPSGKHPFDTAFQPYPMNYPLPSHYTTMHPQQNHHALFMPDTSFYKPQPFHFMPNFGGLPPPPGPYDLFPPAPSSLGDHAIYDPASSSTTSGQAAAQAAAAAHHAAAAASAYPGGVFIPPPLPPPSAAGVHPHPLFNPPPPLPYPWSPHESYPFDQEVNTSTSAGETTAAAVPAPSTFMNSPSPPASTENGNSKSEADMPLLSDAFSAMKLKDVSTTSLMHELPPSSTHLMGSNPVWEPFTGLTYKK
ncbi:hypothetical protein BCR43DRAFT_527390 [Syncephalastrum racemosum]|uniref:RRM domain-containing protein n=1 Tax=Syncephalastrum racemosum TaxID=13706 RepID=A0A1X2H2S0_SYNRA|nr:hypothetical protein BCR43DRAFT_527390 [Syncephalastrum racemosum]